jgi:hypothetical protein
VNWPRVQRGPASSRLLQLEAVNFPMGAGALSLLESFSDRAGEILVLSPGLGKFG